MHKDLSSAIFASSVSGVRSGRPGQPFDADVRVKKLAEARLERITRADSAYDLYVAMRNHAAHDMDPVQLAETVGSTWPWLRGCDLVSLKVRDTCHGDQAASRVVVATASGVNANLARRWVVGAEQRASGGERLRKQPNESGRTSSSHSPFRSHLPPSSGFGRGMGPSALVRSVDVDSDGDLTMSFA